MTAILRAAALVSFCFVFGGVSGEVLAQNTVTSHKRIPQDPAAVALSNTLAEAQAALDRADFVTAVSDYQSYLEKRPDDAAVHFQLGYALTGLEKLDEAKVQYQRAIDLNPKMAEAYLNLGLTLLDSNPSAAIAPLQKATELLPNQERAKFALAVAYERTGKASLAIEQYQAAEKLDGKDFETHLALARLLLSAGRAADAEPEFHMALELQKNSIPARAGLIQSLTVQKKSEAAARELDAYLELAPNDHGARIQRASLLFDAGKPDEALAELDRASKDNTEDLPALKLRAIIYAQKKQYSDAIPVLVKAIALAPQDANLPAELGHAYLEKKDYPNAIPQLIVAMKVNPGSLDVVSDLVAAEYLNKNYAAALSGLDFLAQHETLPLGSWFIRATCYDKLNQKAPALDAYQRFLQLNKDENSDMYFEAAARSRTLARELKENKR